MSAPAQSDQGPDLYHVAGGNGGRYLRHRMYISLQRISEKNDSPQNSEEEVDETDSLYEKVIDEAVSGRLPAPGGRMVEHPTFNVISEVFELLQIKVYYDDGELIRKFPHRTRRRTLKFIVYTGFHPAIYLEPFRPALDLWRYKRAPT